MKRWFGTYKGAKILNNSSTNSKWVAKIGAYRMTTYVPSGIVSEIWRNFFVGIVGSS